MIERVLAGKDIVCVSSLDWEAMWTSKQQIMHRLAQNNRVLYVEEPVTMLAPLKVPARIRRWKAVLPRLLQVEGPAGGGSMEGVMEDRRSVPAGLWTLTLPPLVPFGNMNPWINRMNQRLIGAYLKWAIARLGFGPYIFWTYLPGSVALLRWLCTQEEKRRRGLSRPSLVVYHCVDEHSAFPGLVSPEVVKSYDDELTRRADLVITTADNLRLSREALNPCIHTVHNAADVEIFRQALDPDLFVPEDLAAIPEPRLGVVGMHDSRLDVEALEVLAQADPSWQVVLIGPLKPGQVDETRLRRRPNIHLLGEKRRRELPAYLKGLAVALIPYVQGELTRNIFPLKLFEYLAAGLPVVAGGLPELRRYAGVIELAESPKDYPRLVRKVLDEDGPDKRAARVALAAENTWDRRVEEISALVEEALARVAKQRGERP